MLKRYQMLASFIILLLGAAPAFAEPGEESILSSGTIEARLYLAEVHRGVGGLITALGLAWMPEDVEARCLGKDFKYCVDLDQCARWGKGNDSCVQVGAAKGGLPPRKPGLRPTRLLMELVTDEVHLRSLVRRWGLKPGADGVEKLNVLTLVRSARASVCWEQWTNGENYRLRSLRKR